MLWLLFPEGRKAATWSSFRAEPVELNGWRRLGGKLKPDCTTYCSLLPFGTISNERTTGEAVYLRCKKRTMSQWAGLLCLDQIPFHTEGNLHTHTDTCICFFIL